VLYLVARSAGPVVLLGPAVVGGLVGALCGWAMRRSWRVGPWLSVAAVAIAAAVVVVPALLSGRQNWQFGSVVWAVVLVPVVYTVGVLVRGTTLLAGVAAGMVGSLLAVY